MHPNSKVGHSLPCVKRMEKNKVILCLIYIYRKSIKLHNNALVFRDASKNTAPMEVNCV
jgi:hypothetical protein